MKKTSLDALAFALQETALYLDGHPSDKRALDYYEKTKADYESELKKYECSNGPLTLSSNEIIKNGTWQWVNTPWPWQNDKRGN